MSALGTRRGGLSGLSASSLTWPTPRTQATHEPARHAGGTLSRTWHLGPVLGPILLGLIILSFPSRESQDGVFRRDRRAWSGLPQRVSPGMASGHRSDIRPIPTPDGRFSLHQPRMIGGGRTATTSPVPHGHTVSNLSRLDHRFREASPTHRDRGVQRCCERRRRTAPALASTQRSRWKILAGSVPGNYRVCLLNTALRCEKTRCDATVCEICRRGLCSTKQGVS